MAIENPARIDPRRHALLMAIVHDYVATAEPVGSRSILREHSLGVRSATVRSMMGELEDEGYLYQPHTSAGRVPTELGFRYYVNHVMPTLRVGMQERSQIEYCFSERSRGFQEAVRESSRLLANLTKQAAVVIGPRLEDISLDQVNFVRIRSHQVLALFIPREGGAQNRLIESSQDYSQAELDRMAAYLNEALHGRTLKFARTWVEQSLGEERARYDRMFKAALTLGERLVSPVAETDIYVEGSSRVLDQPEFNDPARLREMLRALEDKTALLELLERSVASGGLSVSIGSENADIRLSDFSVIASSYGSGSHPLGSVAVLGPVRMDYERVIPLVEYTARTLSRVFESEV